MTAMRPDLLPFERRFERKRVVELAIIGTRGKGELADDGG